MLMRTLERGKRLYTRTSLAVKRRLDLFKDPDVDVYHSHGTREWLEVKGRVHETEPLFDASDDAPLWRNAFNTLLRLESDELPDARLRLYADGQIVEARADHEGFFRARIDARRRHDPGWHDVTVELVDSLAGGRGLRRTAPVLVPDPEAHFAVVSDLDDTVIHSGVTELLTEARLALSKNARNRVAFPGVAAFYRALVRGPDGRGTNPIFYVSRNNWNLFDFFVEFFREQHIPPGPFFLEDISLVERPSERMAREDHKHDVIAELMDTYPELPFVLIGDAGDDDPEIYARLAREHPGRIRAVYIRDVLGEDEEPDLVEAERTLQRQRVPLTEADQTATLAEDAHAQGLISAAGLEEVRRRAMTRDPPHV